MSIYRAYRLDEKKDFKSGCWINASSDHDAKRKASQLCEDGTSGIEVWKDSQWIDEVDCDDNG